ncbi:MAG: PAS domain-containing protein, partial [Rhodocyclaceae bacterium]|nr:PAS domain-containing protein [Rhodocyclaceae bacterium]
MNRSRFRTLLLDCLRCIGLVWAGLIVLAPVPAAAAPAFARIFTSHDVVMLLIDPVSGQIVDANPAAARFYGYPQRELRALGIDRLNTFSPAQVAEERQLAASEGRNYFIFRHRLASGDIRTVEVYSHPYVFDGRRLLLSIIHDITPGRFSRQDLWHYQAQLESMVDAQVKEIAANRARNTTVLLLGLLLQFGVIVALVLSNRRRRRVQHERDEIAAALADERRRLLDILHGTGAGTWEWDMRSDALRVNPTWLGFLGSSARAEGRLTDAAAQAFIHPHDLMRCLAARQQHLEGAHDEYECELRVRRHDGEWIWVLDRGRVVGRDPDGTPNCM